MSLHSLRQAQWLRTALRVLVLCFALGTLAHAGHTHDADKAGHTHYNCDYCTSFGGLINAPTQLVVATHCPIATFVVALPAQRIVLMRPVGVAQARAPPVFLLIH
ncbi:MAG: hypothetical protein QM808_01635 [Steroidobacteraceae bacterium]